ncbi:GGDEF and EAL domain-containing protein [Paraburkholderia sp. C35]|uniref:putative bifunctional diguanylate cyclase/phosphodiesterase n=1 Tax=Paraburkholderia sp. C35 TaxID=2126993 RepID=UPI000D69B699|nr:GGDEF and EAL domain-containing protein [Paraburkholderia sp. C35]
MLKLGLNWFCRSDIPETKSADKPKGSPDSTLRKVLTVIAVMSIFAAIATSATLAMQQTEEQEAVLGAIRSSGRLKRDLDQLQRVALDEHGDLYALIGTTPFYRRSVHVLPLKDLQNLTEDARRACQLGTSCISKFDQLDAMLEQLAKRTDALGARLSKSNRNISFGDEQLSALDAYFYSVMAQVVDVRMQTDASVDATMNEASRQAQWLSRVSLISALTAAALLLALIYRNARIAGRLRAALRSADHARAELFKSKQTLEYVLDHVPQGIAWKDASHRYVGGNEVYANDAGLASKDSLIGLSDYDLKWGDDAALVQQEDVEVMNGEITRRHFERAAISADGRNVWISETKLPLEDHDGNLIGVLRAYEDITARRSAEIELRIRGRALEASVNGIVILERQDDLHVVTFVNQAFERITGYAREDVVGLNYLDLFSLANEPEKWTAIQTALHRNSEANATLLCARRNGERFWINVLMAPVRDDEGTVSHHVGVVTDVSSLLEYQRKLEHQARYDSLTKLPNRTQLEERLSAAISDAKQSGKRVSLLFLDLDRFKEVNDSLGHRIGDALLLQVARRLQRLIPSTDLIVRYGGDEFIVVVQDSEEESVNILLKKIVYAMSEPFRLDEHELYVEVSIGVSTYPQDGPDADTLIRNADTAMYVVKANGRNGYQHFQAAQNLAAAERLRLSTQLRKAVKGQHLQLAYQPQIDMLSGRIIGVEALIRWEDDELGMVSPSTFIPVAEETGLIGTIGEWVLETACRQAKVWINMGLPQIRMSVNVSPVQLERSDVVAIVRDTLARTGLPADRLELEVTEGALMRNPDDVARTLREIRELGVKIAIDDFGTGYSSLSYLTCFSVDRIKIDRAFVREIGLNEESEALARAIISIAHSLKFEVLAEGVESEAHREFLIENGCKVAQGFLFSAAVNGESLASMLTQDDESFVR